MVINRYDWSHYDSRGKSDDDDNDDDGDFDPKIGLADYAAAGRGDHGVESDEGVILRCEGEYEFGRFAFDPEGDIGEAHAFLYFRTTTDFASTGFLGRPPLRKEIDDVDDDSSDPEWTPYSESIPNSLETYQSFKDAVEGDTVRSGGWLFRGRLRLQKSRKSRHYSTASAVGSIRYLPTGKN